MSEQAQRPFFVVNPTAGSGRLGRRWDRIAKEAVLLFGAIEFKLTTRRGEASVLAREAVRAGHRLIVACGGDGTVNEVLNGLVDESGRVPPGVVMGVIPFGTGGDLRRTLMLKGEWRAHLERLKHGRDRVVDVGRVEFVGHDGQPGTRAFFNVVSCGLGGEVTRLVGASRSSLRRCGRCGATTSL